MFFTYKTKLCFAGLTTSCWASITHKSTLVYKGTELGKENTANVKVSYKPRPDYELDNQTYASCRDYFKYRHWNCGCKPSISIMWSVSVHWCPRNIQFEWWVPLILWYSILKHWILFIIYLHLGRMYKSTALSLIWLYWIFYIKKNQPLKFLLYISVHGISNSICPLSRFVHICPSCCLLYSQKIEGLLYSIGILKECTAKLLETVMAKIIVDWYNNNLKNHKTYTMCTCRPIHNTLLQYVLYIAS